MYNLASELTRYSNGRRRVRRKICAKLREHKDMFEGNWWLLNKINNNYMSDLSDAKLIFYLEELRDRLDKSCNITGNDECHTVS